MPSRPSSPQPQATPSSQSMLNLVFALIGLLSPVTEAFTTYFNSLGHKPFRLSSSLAAPRLTTTGSTAKMTDATQEWDVDKYQQQHSFVWKYGSSLVDLVFPEKDDSTDTAKDLNILDIGCGSGELTAQLAQHTLCNQVVGLDADPQMIQAALKQFPHLTFLQADVRDFDLGESAFDVVFSNAALHWIPSSDMDQAISRISRALKPGGKLVVELGGKGNIACIEAAIKKQRIKSSSPWYFPSIADFTSRLESVGGIETTTALLYDRPTILEGKDGMKNWLRMFGQHFWRDVESGTDLELVLNCIEDDIKPLLWNGQDWIADYRRLRVVGTKL